MSLALFCTQIIAVLTSGWPHTIGAQRAWVRDIYASGLVCKYLLWPEPHLPYQNGKGWLSQFCPTFMLDKIIILQPTRYANIAQKSERD